MREILFRIKYNKTWYYGYPMGQIKCKKVAFKGNKEKGNNYYSFLADAETLGQYTGLKDKNGTKIFEGDICLCNRHIADSVDKRTFEIIFDGEWVGLSNKFYGSQISYEEFDLCEVIGNIYDNLELLENKNDN